MKAQILVYVLPALILTIIYLAEAQQPRKVARIGYLSPSTASARSANSNFRQVYATLVTLKGRTSPQSTDMRRGSSIGSLSLRPSWCALRLISSWEQEAAPVLAAKNATKTIPIVAACRLSCRVGPC